MVEGACDKVPLFLANLMRNSQSSLAICALAIAVIVLIPTRTVLAQSIKDRQQIVRNGNAKLQVTLRGRGTAIVFIPSLGRGVHDFDDLSRRLAKSGYESILPEPRGIGASIGPLDGITLHDLAADVTAVIQALGARPVIIVGHAFGNRVARVVATDHPELVKKVILLAAGGDVPMSEKTQATFARVFDATLSKEERLSAIQSVFFAGGHDPKVWAGGWYFDVAKAQQAANRATPVNQWWAGGSAPMLVLQGTEDIVAVPENSAKLEKEFPNRVRVVQIPNS